MKLQPVSPRPKLTANFSYHSWWLVEGTWRFYF